MKKAPLLAVLVACSSPPRATTTQPPSPGTLPDPAPAVVDQAQAPVAAEDPYLWLEEVTSDKALAWAREQNTRSKAELEAASQFAPLRDRLRAILDSKDKTPYVQKRGTFYYNFWRDAQHAKGLYRRTTLAEYKKKNPKWETILDVDALAKQEN